MSKPLPKLFVPDGKTHNVGCAVHYPAGECDCYLSWDEHECRAMGLDPKTKRFAKGRK